MRRKVLLKRMRLKSENWGYHSSSETSTWLNAVKYVRVYDEYCGDDKEVSKHGEERQYIPPAL